MSEVYAPDGLDLPKPYDTSFDLRQLVSFFSARFKNFQKDVCNSWLFSLGLNWLCVKHSRGATYRVVGRILDFDVDTWTDFEIFKTTIEYDVFYVGSLTDCQCRFVSLCRALVLSWSQTVKALF